MKERPKDKLEEITLQESDLLRITRLHEFEKMLLAAKCQGAGNKEIKQALGVCSERVRYRHQTALIKAAHIIYGPYDTRPTTEMVNAALQACMRRGYIHAPADGYAELIKQHKSFKYHCSYGARRRLVRTPPADKI